MFAFSRESQGWTTSIMAWVQRRRGTRGYTTPTTSGSPSSFHSRLQYHFVEEVKLLTLLYRPLCFTSLTGFGK